MIRNAFLVCLIFLQSCSVYLAADGKHEPHIGHFTNGISRFQVESVLGAPVSVRKNNKEAIAIYEFEVGNEPDSTRALAWLVADIFLVFIPELIGTPYELSKGEIKRIKVIYDETETVTDLQI